MTTSRKRPKEQKESKLSLKNQVIEYDPENNPPRFSLKLLIKGKKFGWESLEKTEKIKFADKIHRLSQYSWAELRHIGRHSLGSEKISKDSLKFMIPIGVPKECDILVFRFDSLAGMLGFRSAFGTFYIIAFDGKFKAYEH